jgi:hypothetical protein
VKRKTPHLPQVIGKKGKIEVLPSTREVYSPEQVIAAIHAARGMVSVTARTLGCDRNTVYNYRDKYPEVASALEEAPELQLDVAELNLFKAIDRSEPWSICFYLKTKGRKRGYVEHHEISGELTLKQLVGMIVVKEPKAEPFVINEGGP